MAKPSSGTLRQGVWGCSPPEAIDCLVFEVPKSKVYSTFDGLLKDADKCMYIFDKREHVMLSVLPTVPYPRFILITPETI